MFDSTTDATKQEYSVFIHYNYQGWDLGTYYSEDNKVDALALYMPLMKWSNQVASSVLYYYGSQPKVNLPEKIELAMSHIYAKYNHTIRSGLSIGMLPTENKAAVSNAHLRYKSPPKYGFQFVGALYYNYDIDNEEHLPGGKLGLLYQTGRPEKMQIGLSVQKNAIGDFEILVIPDEMIFSFTLSSRMATP